MINVDEEISLAYLLDPAFQLVNTAGKPLTDGWLEVYIHGTRNKYYCYKDWDKEFLHPFKIPLDSLGSNIVLASPAHAYDIYVYNKFGSLIMSRYNIVPVTGDGTVIKDVVNIKSVDGTVTVNSSDQTNWDLSIKDTVDKVNQNTQDISGVKVELSNHKEEINNLTVTVNNHTTQIGQIQEDIVGIESTVANKKDRQPELNFAGSATKTIKKITQYPNGELNVEFEDIDLPQEVPNVDITSADSSVNITTSVDAGTNTKTFDLSVNVEDAPTFGRFVANNGLTLTKTEGNMTLSSDGKIQLKKGKGYHFTIRGNYYNDTLTNNLLDISFIEYSRNETIPIIVDGTLSTSQAQPFEISFDVAQRTSDLNYGIAFSGLTSNGHITGLRVEVHDINSVSVNGGGSGGSGKTYTGIEPVNVDNDNNTIEVDIMQGASSGNDGKSGIVPKPLAGQDNHVLTGNGKWMHRLGDAPADGNLYGQKNGTWQQVHDIVTQTSTEIAIFQVNKANKFVTVYKDNTVNELNIPSFNSFISSHSNHIRLFHLPNGMLAASNGAINKSYPSFPDVVTSNNDAYTISSLFPTIIYTGISVVYSHDDTIYFGTINEDNNNNTPIYLLSYDRYTGNKSIIWSSEIDTNLKGFSSVQYIDDTFFISYFNEGTTNVYKIIAVRNGLVTELCRNSSLINGVIKVNNHYIAFNRTEYNIYDLDLNYVETRKFSKDVNCVRLIDLQHNSSLVCTQIGTLIRINDDFSYDLVSLPNTSNMAFRSISYVTEDNIAYFNGVRDYISTVFAVNIDNLNVISTNVYNDTIATNCRTSVVYRALQQTLQVQSDWNEHNVNSPAYINNKPDFDWKDISNSVTKNISSGSYSVLYNPALKMVSIDFKIDLFDITSTDYIDILTLNNNLYKPTFTNIACSCYAILSNGSTDSLTCIAFVDNTGKMKMKFNSVNIIANISIHVMYTV